MRVEVRWENRSVFQYLVSSKCTSIEVDASDMPEPHLMDVIRKVDILFYNLSFRILSFEGLSCQRHRSEWLSSSMNFESKEVILAYITDYRCGEGLRWTNLWRAYRHWVSVHC